MKSSDSNKFVNYNKAMIPNNLSIMKSFDSNNFVNYNKMLWNLTFLYKNNALKQSRPAV